MKLDTIGGLWLNKKKGDQKVVTYGNIKIEGKQYDIVVFRNKFKLNDKQPDFTVCLNESKMKQSLK